LDIPKIGKRILECHLDPEWVLDLSVREVRRKADLGELSEIEWNALNKISRPSNRKKAISEERRRKCSKRND